jgi:hypothetical protein
MNLSREDRESEPAKGALPETGFVNGVEWFIRFMFFSGGRTPMMWL